MNKWMILWKWMLSAATITIPSIVRFMCVCVPPPITATFTHMNCTVKTNRQTNRNNLKCALKLEIRNENQIIHLAWMSFVCQTGDTGVGVCARVCVHLIRFLVYYFTLKFNFLFFSFVLFAIAVISIYTQIIFQIRHTNERRRTGKGGTFHITLTCLLCARSCSQCTFDRPTIQSVRAK